MLIPLTLIVEDDLSDAVAKKMIDQGNRNYEVVGTYLWNKDKIKMGIGGINQAAKGHAYFVLTDQDTHDRCPPVARAELSVPLHKNLFYRFAVMETEAWLLAHRAAIAKFLSVPENKICQNPESIDKPKEYLIALARASKSREIRKDIVPPADSTSRQGPNYNGKLIQFVTEKWDAGIASQSSQSLRRACTRLKSFAPPATVVSDT